jgi:hypothetical protein
VRSTSGPPRSEMKSHGSRSVRVARYRLMARSSSPAIGCSTDSEFFDRVTQMRAWPRFTSSRRNRTASPTRSPCRYIMRIRRWSRIPCRPALAASSKRSHSSKVGLCCYSGEVRTKTQVGSASEA